MRSPTGSIRSAGGADRVVNALRSFDEERRRRGQVPLREFWDELRETNRVTRKNKHEYWRS